MATRAINGIRKLISYSGINGHASISSRMYSARPRRAVLYVPGSDINKLTKAQNLKVDCIIMDCEDGVAINKKNEARENIHSILNSDPILENGPERSIRVNSVDSGLCGNDLEALLSAKHLPPTIWLPKIDTMNDLQWFAERVWTHLVKRPENDRGPINLGLLIESAKAIMTLPELCSTAEHISTMAPVRPIALVVCSEDLIASLGAIRSPNAIELFYSRQRLVLVAKAFGWQAIDINNIEYKNLKGLQAESEEGARMGFTGKQIIHPCQVAVVQDAFRPSKERLQWAKGLIQAFDEHQARGEGAFSYRGFMIDMPMLRQAQNIVRMAEECS